MQFITLYYKNNNDNIYLYSTGHIRNGSYLEREDETDKFKYLYQVCDVSPTGSPKSFDLLISDLTIVLEEAKNNNDTEIILHIKLYFIL